MTVVWPLFRSGHRQGVSLWGQSLKGHSLAMLTASLLCVGHPLHAQGVGTTPELANRQLPDPAKEKAATDLMHGLRCIQCQGQSIADSDAPMAATMRAEVRQQIAEGESADSVRQWMIGRYGEWVSFEPDVTGIGLLLWLAPLLLLAVAFFLARGLFRRQSKP
jgi:cytochrome c-type biogenesis protein CcmH/NrfF